MSTEPLTIVGGGLAGLVAAISAAEAGSNVQLLEAHARLGGRARSTPGPYVANDGPHVLYGDGALWAWLVRRKLARPYRRLPLAAAAGIRFRQGGRLRAAPPAGLLRLIARRRRRAPVDADFRSWVAAEHGEELAATASAFAGVITYTADPGRLSAAFVEERLLRVSNPAGGPRYLVSGWGALIDRLEEYARGLHVHIETGARVTELPAAPVVVATSLLFTGTDPTRRLPHMRRLAPRVAALNEASREVAEEYGTLLVDLWPAAEVFDSPLLWSPDRLHLNSEGHRRVAGAVLEALGLPSGEDWRAPLPPVLPVPWHQARTADARWLRSFAGPWLHRRLTGRSSGDGLEPKRPMLDSLR